MAILTTQSNTIKDYAFVGDIVFIFSTAGVDIYQTSFIEWTRLGFASLDNVTSGGVNDNGIWLGTSDSGVWNCPVGNGDLSSQLRQYYATSGTSNAIQSDIISHVSGFGTSLIVTHDAGAEYFPAVGTPFQYSDVLGCGAATVNATYIAYAVDVGLQTIALPTAEWVAGDTTILTTGSSPALSSDTVNHVAYGSGNNLFIGTGSGLDVYDYTDIISLAVGSVPFVWPNAEATQVLGDVALVDGSGDVIIIDIENGVAIETHDGPFVACWIDDQADLSLYDNFLERHVFIDHVSPAVDGRNITRSWSLYFEIGDTIHGISSSGVTVKVDGVTVSPTFTAFGSGFSSGFSSGFGGEGFSVSYTPPSASGYRKTVTVEVIAVDSLGQTITETWSFTTGTASNTAPSGTKPPNVIVYKDLSLVEYEDLYNGVGVNWLDEVVSAYIVDESQAEAMATVLVEDGIYHQTVLTLRVNDTDSLSNATQDIQKGDILLVDVDGLDLVNQKCEVLAKQRVINLDRIEYNLVVAFYEVWS